MQVGYRGRLAPSPTGLLHIGHAYTFWTVQKRAREHGGVVILRNEDLDGGRSRSEFVEAAIKDLQWLQIDWQEGYGVGGDFGPYNQSLRISQYRSAFDALRESGLIYPCTCSRQDVMQALSAPHELSDEPIYPGTCRTGPSKSNAADGAAAGKRISWRFRVPDGAAISYCDGRFGDQSYTAGRHFGDFVVWRHDDLPSYQLAVVVDDAAMKITEVVRGQDLQISTARQLLLYQALGLTPPKFYHCPLICDTTGARLAKRHASLAIATLRQDGVRAEDLKQQYLDSNGERFAMPAASDK